MPARHTPAGRLLAALLAACLSATFVAGLSVTASPAGAAGAAELRIGDIRLVEGDGPTNAPAKLAVRLTAPLTTGICVYFDTVDGSAHGAAKGNVHDPDHDFISRANKFVKIPAGKVAATISIPILYDEAVESEEGFVVVIDDVRPLVGTSCSSTSTTAVTVIDGSGSVEIVDDDAHEPESSVELFVGLATVPEGNGPQNVPAHVPVQLSAPLPAPHCIWYHTEPLHSTAVGGSKPLHDGTVDYLTRTNKFVKLAAGKTNANIALPVVYDTRLEDYEWVAIVVDKVTPLNGTACDTVHDPAVELGGARTGYVDIRDEDGSLPTAPTDLTATSDEFGVVQLSWVEGDDGGAPLTYTLEYSIDGGNEWDTWFSPPSQGQNPMTLCCVWDAGMTFRLRAANALGASAFSEPSNTVYGPPRPGLPQTPTNLTVEAGTTPYELLVSWTPTAPTEGEFYTLEQSKDGGASWTVVPGNILATTYTQTPSFPDFDGPYTFRVTARNDLGPAPTSAPSNTFNIELTPPGNVTLAPDPVLNSWVNVSWTPATGTWPVDSYGVELSNDGGTTWTAGATSVWSHVTTASFPISSYGTYTARVTTVGAAFASPSADSNPITVTLETPTNLVATPSATPGSIDLSWTASAGTWTNPGYWIEVSTDDGLTWSGLAHAGGPSYTHATNTHGIASYRYRVSAFYGGTSPTPPSAPTNAVTIDSGERLPGAPLNVSASINDPLTGSVDVSWDPPAFDGNSAITRYDVTYTIDGSSWWGIPAVDGSTTTLSHCCADLNGMRFRVSATNIIGEGPTSAESNTVYGPNVPDAPTNVTVVAGTFPDLIVSWTPGAQPGVSYMVEASNDGGATWTFDGGSVNGTSRAMDSFYSGFGPWIFRVSAMNVSGTSAPSAPSAPFLIHLDAPTDVTLAPDSEQSWLTATWTAATGTWAPEYYRVEYSTDGGGAWWEYYPPAFGLPPVTGTSVTFPINNGLGTYIARITSSHSLGYAASAPSNPVTVSLDPPTSVAATPSATPGSIDVTWTASAGTWPDAGYVVEVSTDDGETWSTADVGGDTSFTHATGTHGIAAYRYRVSAFYSAAGPTAPSPPTDAITIDSGERVPGAPTNVVAAIHDPTTGSVDISWDAPAFDGNTPITNYYLEHSPNGGVTWGVVEIVGGTTTSVVHCCVDNNGAMFRVVAANLIGTGDPSAPSATVYGPDPPDAPTNVTVTAGAEPDLVVSWAPGALPGTGYVVESSNDGGATWTYATGTSGTSASIPTYTGGEWRFRVVAFNLSGASSPTTSAPFLVHLDAPTDVSLAVDSNQGWLTATWTPSASTWSVSYQLDYSTDGGTTWWSSQGGTPIPPTTGTTMSFPVSGFSTHIVRVTAYGSPLPATSSASNPVTISLDTPTNVSATASSTPGSIDLSWNASSGTWPNPSYWIEVSTDDGWTWEGHNLVSSTSYTFSPGVPGPYRFRVSAYYPSVGLTPPSPPTNPVTI